MKMQILSMALTDFKGCKNAKYDFYERTGIVGENGCGKTTIADAFYWVFFDKNYALNSNPDIRPSDGRECTPRVDLELEIDGKPVTVSKMQKEKRSKPDANGVIKRRTLTNTYEINSVPKTERDFKEYLLALDVDFEKFLQLSHPDLFIAGMNEKKTREQIRNTLFEMAGTLTDLEIAQMTDGVEDLKNLLEKYSREEIEAMQNATLRKIRENYGKDGEILRAKIEGLESAKAHIDVAEMELGKKTVQELIKSNESKQVDLGSQLEECQNLSDNVLSLKFELNNYQREANAEHLKKVKDLQHEIDNKKYELISLRKSEEKNQREINLLNAEIKACIEKRNNLANMWKQAKSEVFDETSVICPTCGQNLPEEEASKIRSEYENNKQYRLEKIEADGSYEKQRLGDLKEKLEKVSLFNTDNELIKAAIEKEIEKLEEQLGSLPIQANIVETEKYKQLQEQIAEKEKAIEKYADLNGMRSELKVEHSKLQEDLMMFEREIAKSENDNRIDEQIIELRKKQAEYEQSKADCEKIIEQLKTLSIKKNELLTEKINKCFELVKWQLFEYQKNGEYKETCVPIIDNKRFGVSTNKGREILAKLDIVKGLQKFYSQNYPVFLDNAESLSLITMKRITMECQLVMMCVGENQFVIKKEV